MKFYPYKKRGEGTTSLSHVEGWGGTNSFELVLTPELEVLAILNYLYPLLGITVYNLF